MQKKIFFLTIYTALSFSSYARAELTGTDDLIIDLNDYSVIDSNPKIEPKVLKSESAPAKYFEFSSEDPSVDWPHKEKNLAKYKDKLRGLIKKYGKNILVGADYTHANFKYKMQIIRELGLKSHIYLGGPMGVTGEKITPEEAKARRDAARSVGINIKKSDWLSQWNSWGWKTHTRNQIKQIQKDWGPNFSYEIDNLYMAKIKKDEDVKSFLNCGDSKNNKACKASQNIGSSAELISFYREQDNWQKENKIQATLLMKNIHEDEMVNIANATKNNILSRDFFSDFHISEKGTGDRSKQAKMSELMGVQTVPSNNTYDYDARGEYLTKPYVSSDKVQSASKQVSK